MSLVYLILYNKIKYTIIFKLQIHSRLTTVEERIETWSPSRLKKEGFTLFDLLATTTGTLYQDHVYRFHYRTFDPLPYHKFAVGDAIRISISNQYSTSSCSNSNNENYVDGIVLDRRNKYLDVAIKSTEIDFFEHSSSYNNNNRRSGARSSPSGTARHYRLDTFLNRVSFDRMIESLQLFLSPNTNKTSSRTLRDLILYSYPNSMLRLADSPGGLKLALPLLDHNNNNMDSNMDTNNINTDTIPTMTTTREDITTPFPPSSPLSTPFPFVTDESLTTVEQMLTQILTESSSSPSTATANNNKKKAYSQNPSESNKGLIADSTYHHRSSLNIKGVFQTNKRLQMMVSNFPVNPKANMKLYTYAEIRTAMTEMGRGVYDLNPSQSNAVLNAILRPLSLIQGPPGLVCMHVC